MKKYFFRRKINGVLKKVISANKKQNIRKVKHPRMVGYVFDNITTHALVDGWQDGFLLENLNNYLNTKSGMFDGACLDIGANVGFHTIFYSNIFKFVYSFEPNPLTYKLLEINTASYLSDNVEIFNSAISPKIYGDICMSDNDLYNSGKASVVQKTDGFNKISVFNEDDIHGLMGRVNENITFIKIDVEGYGPEVVKTLRELLVTNRPIIGFEVHNHKHFEKIIKELEGIFKGFSDKIAVFDVRNYKSISIDKVKDDFHPMLCIDLSLC